MTEPKHCPLQSLRADEGPVECIESCALYSEENECCTLVISAVYLGAMKDALCRIAPSEVAVYSLTAKDEEKIKPQPNLKGNLVGVDFPKIVKDAHHATCMCGRSMNYDEEESLWECPSCGAVMEVV